MKIVTYNIRRDCDAGINAFENRKPYIQKKILEEKPDIIGFQEVMPHVGCWLQQALSGYYVLNCGRDEQYGDESVSIAFRIDRYNLLNYHTFWLSDDEDCPGSRYAEQSEFARICSVATLQEQETGRCFAVFNTHLDHEAESARRKGILKILSAMQKMPYPVLLTGDLNTFPGSRVTELIALSGQALTDITQNVGDTFHDFGRLGEKLDYIYVGEEFRCDDVRKWEDCWNGVYLSDHYPVCGQISWR